MAKWDLSKLPEGRKPLPDEWFAERAQMQERINGLEAELAEYKYVASAIDTQWAESQDEIADLKAKLAKTVEALQFYGTLIDEKHECPWHMNSEDFGAKARTTLKELTSSEAANGEAKGGKYE